MQTQHSNAPGSGTQTCSHVTTVLTSAEIVPLFTSILNRPAGFYTCITSQLLLLVLRPTCWDTLGLNDVTSQQAANTFFEIKFCYLFGFSKRCFKRLLPAETNRLPQRPQQHLVWQHRANNVTTDGNKTVNVFFFWTASFRAARLWPKY